MAIIKCKMCGGELILIDGASTAECEFCGSVQTIPNLDDEKKLIQFERAERLRKQCEFDKAAGIYENIVADYRQEAEAYWGLVLCKYGIEYVDDPATGKKIPTCHRSSFDSIMEDGDFEQVLENADVMARKVYREEAKQIEEIRKGIIAVSANEAPYDIFICYKETDASGDRTLDSVLAQDIYDALTDKGYRVFFSRITLEGILGQDYESYIFAALNSAKIMLAVGTDYEYFNAVWVKNEWSRFLKLMAKDKTKHLIPCFKGIDAYDMPKEFARLQAQDLGKVGAMQDLLRGIEKLLPKQKNTTAIQEKVVVGGSGNNKIASLLDRGNMALEDGDWAKADSFFEDVLNNDSKNAQAYLGKTLAQERCRTIDAFARKRKDASQNVRGEKLELQPNHAHVDEMAAQFSLPGYVAQNAIRKLYDFDLSYHSDVAERKQQYRNEETYWANHKQLSRAEKFAAGAVAENLQREKKALFAALNERVKQAENAEAAAKQDVQARYEAHLKQADEQAEKLYNEGLARREKYYQELLKIAKTSSDVTELMDTAKKFDQLGDFQDSKNLAEHCRKRTVEEQAKLDAEAEAKRIADKKTAAARKAKNKKIGIIFAVAAVLVVAVIAVMTTVVVPGNNYKTAQMMLDNGQFVNAVAAFEALGDYKDSTTKVLETHYAHGEYLLSQGENVSASMAFGKARDYGDARSRSMELWAEIAQRDVISASSYSSVALRSDSTVLASGWVVDDESETLPGWTDIVEVAAGTWYTIGLKADGTVVAAGDNRCGQCDVESWTDIVSIATGSGFTLGLKSDGTVVATGDNDKRQCEVSEWTDIIALDAGYNFSVGLKSDGTVVVAGDNPIDYADKAKWTDIVTVSAGNSHVVGLRSDGTVIAGGANEYYVDDWVNIIAIAAGNDYTLGLQADGTVVSTEKNNQWSGWQDIVALVADYDHSVGLKSDGTAVALGKDEYGETDVSGWTDILVSDNRKQTVMEGMEARQEEDYSNALTYLKNGQHQEAYELLTQLGDFRDAKEYLTRFVPVPIEQSSIWYDGSGNNSQYVYDSNMRLETIEYDGEVRYAFFYHEDGTLKQREEVFSNGIRVHTYNEKGHPIFFGQFNDKKAAYEFSWFFEYTYDTAGNATSVSGRYICGDEEADYTWNVSLSQGDTIEITDLAIGMEHLAYAADNRQIISILRNGGTIREQYAFQFVNLNSYKDGIAMDFIVSPRFVHQLDDSGNVVRTEIRHLSVGGNEIFGETDFILTYNESGYLIEKSYNDSTSNYNDYILSVNGLHGNNVLTYTRDENDLVTCVEWTLGGKLLRTDEFGYEFVYMPESETP